MKWLCNSTNGSYIRYSFTTFLGYINFEILDTDHIMLKFMLTDWLNSFLVMLMTLLYYAQSALCISLIAIRNLYNANNDDNN